MKKLLLFLTLSFISIIAYPQITFKRTYGGEKYEWGSCAIQTNDGGYIVVGGKSTISGDPEFVYFMKTDAYGDTLWNKYYKLYFGSAGYSVAQTIDSGYIVFGVHNFINEGLNYHACLIKTTANGDTMWTNDFNVQNVGYSIVQTIDSGYVFAATKNNNVLLMKTDRNGDSLWAKTYGGNNNDYGNSVTTNSDGGYTIAGGTWSFGAGSSDVYIIRTDANGDTLWTRTYGGSSTDASYSVAPTSDGGNITVGKTYSFGPGALNVYLIRTDANGDSLWTRTYGGNPVNIGYSVAQTSDGGFIITGSTDSTDWTNTDDVYLIRTNSVGDTLWTKTFGGSGSESSHSVNQTNDGGFIIAGTTNSFGSIENDIYLIKTDANGHSVGIKEDLTISSNGIAIFPNPTSGKIGFNTPENFGILKTVEIYSSIGKLQLVKTDNFSNIDVSSLANGLYFIVLTNTEGTRLTAKILKE